MNLWIVLCNPHFILGISLSTIHIYDFIGIFMIFFVIMWLALSSGTFTFHFIGSLLPYTIWF